MIFYLGTHVVTWLRTVSVPLFISNRQLHKRKSFSRALGPWCLDSGGYSELSMFGEWRTSQSDYIASARCYSAEIGNLRWAASQDWMCEPPIRGLTGLTVQEHQQRTISSFLELQSRAPDIHWLPVVQGWLLGDYIQHVEMYNKAGVDLREQPVVGIGSVCRRQGTKEAQEIFAALSGHGIRCHGFGVKVTGLAAYGSLLESADSMAWSSQARYLGSPVCGSDSHINCANCLSFAMSWRRDVIDSLDRSYPQIEFSQEETK